GIRDKLVTGVQTCALPILHAKVHAPTRRFAVAGLADGKLVPVFAAESPAEPIRLEVTDPQLLRLDEGGGLLLDVSVTGGTASERSEERRGGAGCRARQRRG